MLLMKCPACHIPLKGGPGVRLMEAVEKRRHIVVWSFFLLYLCVGLSIFKDYGVSWDELFCHRAGVFALRDAFEGDKLLGFSDKYYGSAFEATMVAVERAFNVTSDRGIILVRHLLTFLVFYAGVVFFYLLAARAFKSWKYGLVGSVFLVVSPRIFAHSFYNSKDIPFLALFIISVFTLIRYLDKKNAVNALFHALACAFLIDIRVVGAVVPVFTALFFAGDFLLKKEKTRSAGSLRSIPVFLGFLALFTVAFWPTLWHYPLSQFIKAFEKMSHYPFPKEILYRGSYFSAQSLPWHYIPVWILISTPLAYSALFLAGCVAVTRSMVTDFARFYRDHREFLLFLLWFFFPLAAVIALRSSLYDEWRQMFFIYPAFLLLALAGLRALLEHLKTRSRTRAIAVAAAVIIFSVLDTAVFMIKYHPFQNVYFNSLAGLDRQRIRDGFELDYWGLSYRQALEHILKADKRPVIRIYAANYAGWLNSLILGQTSEKRLLYVERPEDADYLVSNHRWHREEYPYKGFYSISVDGMKIMSVYSLKEGGPS